MDHDDDSLWYDKLIEKVLKEYDDPEEAVKILEETVKEPSQDPAE